MLACIYKQIPIVGRFILSSGVATSLHWGLMAILIALDVGAGIATAAGSALGALGNYLLQRYFTFRSHVNHCDALPAFVAVATVAWFANLVVFSVLHAFFELALLPAQGLTTLFVALLTFTLYKKVVFHERATSTTVP